MLTEIRVYYEGDKSLKPGFRAFFGEIFERARAARCKVTLIATNGTPAEDFDIAIRKHVDAWNVLLLDSDAPVDGNLTAGLLAKHGWNNTHHESIFWMVEIMESWFHADKGAVEDYYGHGFKRGAMSANPQVEQIQKKDIEAGLKAATKNTANGEYHKTKHAPRLLELIKPVLVRAAAPNCNRLFTIAVAKLV